MIWTDSSQKINAYIDNQHMKRCSHHSLIAKEKELTTPSAVNEGVEQLEYIHCGENTQCYSHFRKQLGNFL